MLTYGAVHVATGTYTGTARYVACTAVGPAAVGSCRSRSVASMTVTLQLYSSCTAVLPTSSYVYELVRTRSSTVQPYKIYMT